MNHLDFPPAVFQGLQHICTQCDHPCASLSPMTVSGEVASSQNKGMYDLQLHKATSSTFKKNKESFNQQWSKIISMIQNHPKQTRSSACHQGIKDIRSQARQHPHIHASARYQISNLAINVKCQSSQLIPLLYCRWKTSCTTWDI